MKNPLFIGISLTTLVCLAVGTNAQAQTVSLENPPLPPTPIAVLDSNANSSSESPSGSPRDPLAECLGLTTLGAGTTKTYNSPINGYYNNSRSTAILLRSEFTTCTPSMITHLAVQVGTASSMNITNLQIWLKKTTATTAPTTWDTTDAISVYGPSTVQFTPLGWKTFDITDFVWDADNLQIMWQWSGTRSGSQPYFYCTLLTTNVVSYGASDASLPTTLTPSKYRVNYQLTFANIPAMGACCTGTSCAITAEADCTGAFQGVGATCTPNLCSGACCYDYPNVQCQTTDSTACNALSGIWHQFQDCATYICPPANDSCSGTTPLPLTTGVPVTITGDTRGATDDCSVAAGNEAWAAFTVPATSSFFDVFIDYCGTSGFTGNYYHNQMTAACPCGTFMPARANNLTSCPDGMITLQWTDIAPGTYYYPIKSDPSSAYGPYTIQVVCRPSYCNVCYTNQTFDWISNVKLNTLDHTTEVDPGGCKYGDHTNHSTDLQLGASYPLTVSFISSGVIDHVWVWIDWNQNYSFTDSGEAYDLGQGTSTTPLTIDLAVPLTALLGPTRMRVMLQFSTDPEPCHGGTFGETEDYTVQVVDLSPTGACCTMQGCTELTAGACQLAGGIYGGDNSRCSDPDCNNNLQVDSCDIAAGTSLDTNSNGIPDECEASCPLLGDMNNDLTRNGLDIPAFVECFFGGGTNCLCGDYLPPSGVDVDDVPELINALLSSE